jgi:excisionase family DNA binding protein
MTKEDRDKMKVDIGIIDKKLTLSVTEAVVLSGIAESDIRKAINIGEIKLVKFGHSRIPRRQIEEWIERNTYPVVEGL